MDQQFKKCSSCKALGHTCHECPKDPNFRTDEDIVEEYNRIL